MSEQSLGQLNKRVVDMSLAAGADACDVISQTGRSFSTSVQNGKIDKYKVSSAQITGLRVIKDHRVGISYSESADDESLSLMVHQAIENSKFAAEDPHQMIATANKEVRKDEKSFLFQEDDATPEEKIALNLRLESELLARNPKITRCPYNGYSDGDMEEAFLNHLGSATYRQERSFSCYTAALAGEQGKQAMYGQSSVARNFRELNPDFCIDDAVEKVVPLIEAKPIPTGRYDIVFDIDLLESFIRSFFSNFSGKEVADGKSKLKDSLGDVIAHKDLSIQDCPMYPGSFYYSSFDDEANPRADLFLVKDGVLQSFLHNSYSASKLKTKTTGHGSRSPKSSLGVGSTQLVIGAGKDSESSLHEGKYLKIISLKGLHSGTNAISGQFSLALEGMLMNGSKVEQYVKDVTISGNFFEMLTGIAGIGDIVKANTSNSFFAPTLRFSAVSLAGT